MEQRKSHRYRSQTQKNIYSDSLYMNPGTRKQICGEWKSESEAGTMDEHRGAWEVENVLIRMVVTQWQSVQAVTTEISALDTLYCMHVTPQLKRKK